MLQPVLVVISLYALPCEPMSRLTTGTVTSMSCRAIPGVACCPLISTPKRAKPTGGQLSGRRLKLEVGAELIWPVTAAATTCGAASICGAATSCGGAGSVVICLGTALGAAANCCGAGSVVICLGAALGKLLESRAATAAAAAAAADLGLPAGLAPPALGCPASALACVLAIRAAISGVIISAAQFSEVVTTPQKLCRRPQSDSRVLDGCRPLVVPPRNLSERTVTEFAVPQADMGFGKKTRSSAGAVVTPEVRMVDDAANRRTRADDWNLGAEEHARGESAPSLRKVTRDYLEKHKLQQALGLC